MKIFVILLLCSLNLFAQNSLYGDDEIFIYQDAGTYTYKMIPFGTTVWDNTGEIREYDQWGRSVFDPLSLNLTGFIYNITNPNGLDYILSSEQGDVPVFGNGIYKISCQLNSSEISYFFLDLRDCGYPNAFIGYNDFTIKYISSNNDFYIVEGKGVSFNDERFEKVTQKLTSVWQVEGIPIINTTCFQNFWQNCLAVGYHYDENNPQPLQILWGRYPDENHYTYYLFREIDSGGFVLIGVFNSSSFNYQDKSILSL